MSSMQGWFAIKIMGWQSAVPKLREIARVAFGKTCPESVTVAEKGEWCTVLLDRDHISFVQDWSQAASAVLRTQVVSFLVLESTWSYDIFSSGEHLAAMDARISPIPLMLGSPGHAADALGVEVSVLERYHAAILESVHLEKAAREAVRAYPGDEFPPWDERAHTDFARKLGIRFPIAAEQRLVDLKTEPAPEKAPALRQLPPRLALEDHLPVFLADFLDYSTFEGQREALNWAQTGRRTSPRMALRALARIDHPSLTVRRWWARTLALFHSGDRSAARTATLELAGGWLQPAKVGAVNQFLSRVEILETLDLFSGPDILSLRNRVREADEPEIIFEEGDTL